MNAQQALNAPRLLRHLDQTTQAFAAQRGQPRGRLEALLFDLRYPALLLGPVAGDQFAGRLDRPLAGLSNQCYPEGRGGDTVGFYYDAERAERLDRAQTPRILGEAKLAQIAAIWRGQETQTKIEARMDEPMRMALQSDRYWEVSSVGHYLFRIASHSTGYETLLAKGVAGWRAELLERAQAATDPQALDFLEAASAILGTFTRVLNDYAREVAAMAAQAEAGAERFRLNRMAQALSALAERAPESFYEAVQLVHLFTLAAYNCNALGRLDDSLGPFLVRDLESGRLTAAQATELIHSHWQLIDDHLDNSRLTLGGRGRRDPEAADTYVRLALEATRRHFLNPQARDPYRIRTMFTMSPQVALRLDSDTPEDIRQQAIDVLAQGVTFPLLYNDEVNVPAVAQAFAIPESLASQYTFFDCGEYLIHNHSVGTPSAILNMPKALEVALHDGIDPKTGKRVGPPNPNGTAFERFEAVWDAYCHQVEFAARQCARFQKLLFDVVREDAALVTMGMTMPACLDSARGLLDGCAMLGGTLETYGNITAADALLAIEEYVYRRGETDIQTLIAQLDAGFAAQPQLRAALLAIGKFGNDDDRADAMAERVNQHICQFTRSLAAEVGLHHYLVVVINNAANVVVGKHVGCSADGREAGEPVSNGHTPTPGRDTQGITALLRSILKLSCDRHAGAVHNLRFSKETFARHPEQVRGLIETYFAGGGTQCMLTVTSRAELEDALAHPEAYPHLLVRVGGFSARFVELPPDIQREIIARNAY